MVTRKSDNITVEGHVGTWYVVDAAVYCKDGIAKTVYLLEHEDYGDEAACLIVDENAALIMEDVWNGFSDLEDDGWEEVEA